MNVLPTEVNLLKRKVGHDNLCPICHSKPENALHIFTQCELAKTVWFESMFQCGDDQSIPSDIQDWLEVKLSISSKARVDSEFLIENFFDLL